MVSNYDVNNVQPVFPETSIDRVAVPRDRTHTITIIKWENRSLYHFGGIGRILNYSLGYSSL